MICLYGENPVIYTQFGSLHLTILIIYLSTLTSLTCQAIRKWGEPGNYLIPFSVGTSQLVHLRFFLTKRAAIIYSSTTPHSTTLSHGHSPPTMAASHLTLFSTTDTLCLLVSTLVATQHCLHSQTTSVSTLVAVSTTNYVSRQSLRHAKLMAAVSRKFLRIPKFTTFSACARMCDHAHRSIFSA